MDDTYPSDDYGTALSTIAPNTVEMIQAQQLPGEPWYQTLTRALPVLAATYEQKQLLQVQVDRAKAGLPPLNMSQYAAGVQVGLAPDTMRALMFAAVGLGAFLLLRRGR